MKKSAILKDGRVNNLLQVADVRRYVLTDGTENGLRVIECVNGKLRFLLNESKALDIMQIFYEGQNVSFVSKNGFTARETDFLNRFEGGALYTCGPDAVGAVEGKPMHGSFHNIPAKVVRAECAEDGIKVEAEIRFSALFGQNLLVRRKIFSAYGSGKIEISDELYNAGAQEEEFCLLYHVNLGYPLLAEGGKIFAETEKAEPRNARAKEIADVWDTVLAPEAGAEEACYYLAPTDGTVYYFNPRSGRKFTLCYGAGLDKFVLWKSNACGDYALGLEPSTTELDDKFRLKKIGAGESVRFDLSFTIE